MYMTMREADKANARVIACVETIVADAMKRLHQEKRLDRLEKYNNDEVESKEDVVDVDVEDSIDIPVDGFWDTMHGCMDINELYDCSGSIAARVNFSEDGETFLYPCGGYKEDGLGCDCELCTSIIEMLEVSRKMRGLVSLREDTDAS